MIPGSENQLPQIACSLNAGDLEERKELIHQTFARWLISSTRGERTLHLRFADDDEAEARLQKIITLESACCPFFSFDLRRAGGSIFLAIGVPPGAESTLDELANI